VAVGLCLLGLGTIWGGCSGGEEQRKDETDVQLGNDVTGGDTTAGALHVELTSPEPGETFVAGADVSVVGRATLSNGSTSGMAWRVESDQTGVGREKTGTLDASGGFSAVLEGLGGGERTITVTIDPDGDHPVTETLSVTILTPAAAPTEVAITPDAPTTEDDLDATVAPAASEGQLVHYRWSRDGETLGTGQHLGRDKTTRGDVITVSAWYEVDGLPGQEASASVTIGNAAPSCAQVSLTPSGLATGDKDLSCACVGFDDPDDGDEDASTCAFYDDADGGALIDTAGSCTLPSEDTAKGMEIRCVLTPSDGQADGESVTAASTTGVTNTPPPAPTVTLTPGIGDATTPLTCNVTSGGPDIDDEETVILAVGWLVDGEVVEGATSVNTTAEDLGAIHGQAVRCSGQADDGQATSALVLSDTTLVLGNATPSLVNVFVEPDVIPATEAATLTCEPKDGTDPDGDELSYVYTWSIDGETLTGETDGTLTADAFARGDKVSCTAAACDPDGACSAPVNAKLTVTIGNAPPTVGGAGLVETPGYGQADGVAQPEDVFTCTYHDVEDLDGDSVDVTYGFYLVAEDGTVTELQTGDEAAYTVPEDLPEGATLHCTVTPSDDADTGAPTESGSIEIVSPSPVAPTVTVEAPDGAEGDVTCAITDPGRWLPDGATTVYWGVNGGAEVTGDATMSAAEVLSCDLLTCRVEVGTGEGAVSSNTASLQMALGSDCDDGDPCTGMACLAEGGCKATLISGPSCDDGDPCTVDDVCQSGTCTAGTQTCVEDRLSVAGPSAHRPTVTATPNHGYAAHWFGSGGGLSFLRLTDGAGSRVAEEVKTAPSVNTNFWNEAVMLGDGHLGVLRLDSHPAQLYVSCGGCWKEGSVSAYLGRYTTDGELVDETAVWTLEWAAHSVYPSWGNRNAGIGATKIQLLSFSDGSLGMIRSFTNGYRKTGIQLRPIAANLTASDPVTLVAQDAMGAADRFDVEVPADGIDHILVAWVGADGQSVEARRFNHDGSPQDGSVIAVADVGADVTAVRVAGFKNGRFVVLWEADGLDGAGFGVMGQRYDDGGIPIGEPFVATGATLGDQRLGDIVTLQSYDFVVAYRDTSDVDPAVTAQRFSSIAAPQGEAVVVNEASEVGGAAPGIAALEGDEWVVAWTDASGVVWTRRYTADGELAPRSAERRVAQTTSGDQRDGDAAREGGGNTFVAWTSPVYIGMGTEIVGRVFDGEGVAVTPEVAVNGYIEGPQSDPVVAGGPDRFVVAWTSEGEDGSVEGVYARRFDGAGEALGEAFGVPETTADTQRHPAVAMTSSGSFAVAWSGYTSSADSSDVYVRLYGSDGTAATGELRVNTSNTGGAQERPAIANIPFTEDYLVIWQTRHVSANGFDIYVRKVGADGATLSPELRVNAEVDGDQRGPALAISQGDVTAICWSSTASGDSDVWCQMLKTSTLAAQGQPFRAHGELPGNQEAPRLTWLSSGRLMVSYTTETLDHDGFAVQTARFDNLGGAVGARRTINRHWTADQRSPWLVAYDDAVFVGYESDQQDGDGYGAYFRVLPITP